MAPVEGAGLGVSGRRPSVPAPSPSPSPPRPARAEREIRATPFKRSRSRVYYASQTTSDSWLPSEAAPKDKSVRRNISLSPSRSAPSDSTATPTSKGVSATKSTHRGTPARLSNSRKMSPGYKEPAILEVSSSGEEAGEGEGEASSPLGSFRGSLRGSPSHRSQDSGYSDSGESNAHNDSDGSPATPPNVKHITRVYFGDSNDSARLYNDKIVCSPELKTSKVSSPSGSPSSLASEVSYGSSGSSPPERRAAPLEELAEELEHKSLLDATAAAAARRTGAVRKRSTNTASSSSSSSLESSGHKRHTRRGGSATSLQEPRQESSRRPAPLRARRRWSAADLQQQQEEDHKSRRSQQEAGLPTHTSRSTSTNDLQSSRAGVTCSLDALDDPVPASRVAADCDTHDAIPRLNEALPRPQDTHATLPPRPQHARRLRIHPTAIAKEMRNGAVSQWLSELRLLYEAECMNTLQSKSVPGEASKQRPSLPSTRDAVRAIQRRAHAVSTEFARLCQRLEWLELDQVPALAKSLVRHINTFLRDYTTQWTAADPGLQPQSSLGRQSKVIEQICQRLTEVCSDDQTARPDDQATTRQVVQVVTALGHAFTKLVDLMLSREIKVVVAALEDPRGEKEVSSAVSHLTALGVDGGHICRLIARLGGVRALLSLCLEPRLRQVRVASLRALATVCCVVEGIVELEKAGGVEVVAEVLCDEDCPEEERSEAAGVLAQVTSPWVEDNHRLTGLHDNMDAIVAALTGLAERTRSAEIFLLASAALANLTFLDGGCVGAMRKAGTARVLLRSARGNPSLSIFTKDQIATVLANLSGSRGAAEEVVASGGVSVLLGLLNTRPAPSHRLPEVATAERVQQKSAIALSRLCGEPDVARKVAQQGGAERLVQLCKDEGERNQSDAVLVACLAALRKMASSLGSDELRDMDAAELVEPRLLDSFLIYSSRQESYV